MKEVLASERRKGFLTLEFAGRNAITVAHKVPDKDLEKNSRAWDKFKEAVLAKKEAFKQAHDDNRVLLDSVNRRITFLGEVFHIKELKSAMDRPGPNSIQGRPEYEGGPYTKRRRRTFRRT